MKTRIWIIFLAAYLLLAGCRRAEIAPPAAPAPPLDTPAPEIRQDEEIPPVALERLTVEVAVAWEDADRMLAQLEELSRLLEDALAASGCTIEEPATVTIGTAGGITAQALQDGGVDAAFLPEGDFAEIEGGADMILACPDIGMVAAVSAAKPALDQAFQNCFAKALAETEAGQEFLAICYSGAVFTIAE